MTTLPDKGTPLASPQESYLKKYAVLGVLLWSAAVFLSLYFNLQQRNQQLVEIGITIARSSFDKDILYRRWNASHGGVYAKQSARTTPNPYLNVSEREITTPLGKQLTLVNPAYMTRQVHELGMLENGVQGHITSLKPIRPENSPDSWEKQALESFEKGVKEVSAVEDLRGQPYLRLMRPLMTEEGCLPCHRHQGYQVGQVRGGISQSVPMTLLNSAKGSAWPLWVGHATLWLLGLLFAYAAYTALQRNMLALNRNRAELLKANQDLKTSQSKLLQSEKMASVGQLAAGVAHEINNPMGFVTSNLRVLKKYADQLAGFVAAQKNLLEKAADSADLEQLQSFEKKINLGYLLTDSKELIEESLQGAERVQTIVKNLKTFSRVDQDGVQSVDLNECIESTLNVVLGELKSKARIERSYGDLPEIICIPQQISQVLINLFLNAAHAITEDGLIQIRSWAEGGTLCFSVSDNGCGIAEEDLSHIFEPFFTTKPIGTGTGLGLSMVYDIIKIHHGEISVDSKVGGGTTFTVKLPAKMPQ